jgi:2'-5' RNA ligase
MPKPRRTLTAADAPPAAPDAPPDPMPQNGMVCLLLEDSTAQALQEAFPPPEGASLPAPPHITVNFLGDISGLDRSAVESAINAALRAADAEEEVGGEGSPGNTDTLTGTFAGLARFAAEADEDGNEGGTLTPIVALFDCPELEDLQEALEDALEPVGMPGPTHGFTAHSTICRVALGDTEPVSLGPAPMVRATFSEVALVWGDYTDPANITKFPLAGSPDVESPPAEIPTPGDEMGVLQERQMPAPGSLGMFEACLVTEAVSTDEVFPDEDGGTTVMGRLIPAGVVTWRTPPIPGGFACDEMGNPADNGHMNAPVACAATEVAREGNRIMARGPYLDNYAGLALKTAVDGGAPIGPSIDLGASDIWEITADADGTARRTLVEGSIAGFVVLPFEAQHSSPDGEWLTWFKSIPGSEGGGMTEPLLEKMPEALSVPEPVVASAALTACGEGLFGAPLYPPKAWLEKPAPQTGEIIGPTVTDDGQVFGHAAGGTCHIGIPGTCVRISDDTLAKDFAVFHKGLAGDGRGIKTVEGDFVQVGQITLAGGHADTRLSADAARKHYDDTDSVIAHVHMTWDPVAGAPWMAGALRHDATDAQVQTFRAAGEVSVDYRQLEPGGKLHLIALPVVPRGGFPPLRALSAGGELRTVIFAGGEKFGATGNADWPLAERDRAFQDSAVEPRIRKWASTDGSGDLDKMDWGKYRSVHFWWDETKPELEQSYKMKFCDVINGRVHAVPRGIFVAAAEMQGARGGVDIPAADKETVRGRIGGYYRRMAKEFNDPSIKAPWDESKSSVTADGLMLDLAKDFYARQLGDEAALLASAHEREMGRLTEALR